MSWFLFLRVRLPFLGLGTVSVEYRTRAFQREDEKTGSSGGFSRRGFSLTFPFIQGSASEEHTASCPPAPPSGPARPRRSGSLTFTGRLRVPRTLSPEPSSCEPRCCDTCGGERAVKAAEREPSGASGGGVKLEPAGNMSEFWHKLGCCVVEKPQPVSVPAPPLENQLPVLRSRHPVWEAGLLPRQVRAGARSEDPGSHFLFPSMLSWAGAAGGAQYLSLFPIVSSSATGDFDMSFLCPVFTVRATALSARPASSLFASARPRLSHSSGVPVTHRALSPFPPGPPPFL